MRVELPGDACQMGKVESIEWVDDPLSDACDVFWCGTAQQFAARRGEADASGAEIHLIGLLVDQPGRLQSVDAVGDAARRVVSPLTTEPPAPMTNGQTCSAAPESQCEMIAPFASTRVSAAHA